MTLKANRASTNEIAAPKKSDSHVNPKLFTLQQAQEINSVQTELNLIDKSNKFYCTDSKMQKQFFHDYHQWGANKKVKETINKRKKAQRPCG